VPAANVSVLCCPTDLRRFDFSLHREARERNRAAWGLGQNPLLLFVGTLVYRKGIDLLLDAVSVLQHEFPTLRIALMGDGPSRASLQARAHALGLTGVVMFLGRMPQAEVPGALAASDICFPQGMKGCPDAWLRLWQWSVRW
jgi:glycosyltransferase involved in cell wall biosynthesis